MASRSKSQYDYYGYPGEAAWGRVISAITELLARPAGRHQQQIGALQMRAYGYRNYEHLKERLLTLHRTKYALQG